jgi:hypothetical protein
MSDEQGEGPAEGLSIIAPRLNKQDLVRSTVEDILEHGTSSRD